jgi:hypothetical protein
MTHNTTTKLEKKKGKEKGFFVVESMNSFFPPLEVWNKSLSNNVQNKTWMQVTCHVLWGSVHMRTIKANSVGA